MKSIKNIFLTLGVAIIALSSCRKDPEPDNDNTGPEPTNGYVKLNINHISEGNALQYNTDYTDDFGNVYQFTKVQYYLSGGALHDGSSEDALGQYLLVDPGQSEYYFGAAAAGHYHDLMFSVGVDSAANHSDPASYEAGHPLAFQSPSTHWNWNSGYIFVRLEGMVDTTGDGTTDGDFLFHLGMDNLRQDLMFTEHADITVGDTTTIQINADYDRFFDGIDLSNDNQTHTMDNMPLANSAINNASNVFSAP